MTLVSEQSGAHVTLDCGHRKILTGVQGTRPLSFFSPSGLVLFRAGSQLVCPCALWLCFFLRPTLQAVERDLSLSSWHCRAASVPCEEPGPTPGPRLCLRTSLISPILGLVPVLGPVTGWEVAHSHWPSQSLVLFLGRIPWHLYV